MASQGGALQGRGTAVLVGCVDILGRLFRFQQERKACRPVRDVSRLTVEVDKTN